MECIYPGGAWDSSESPDLIPIIPPSSALPGCEWEGKDGPDILQEELLEVIRFWNLLPNQLKQNRTAIWYCITLGNQQVLAKLTQIVVP